MAVHIFGIRHHGPGSARSVKQALETVQPDCILIEGPVEGESILNLVAEPDMVPPVALLVYSPEQTTKSAYYPFAEFSPEWQAIKFGLKKSIPVRFIDLPQSHWLAMGDGKEDEENSGEENDPDDSDIDENLPEDNDEALKDPLGALAKAAGYSDSERWWEHLVEQRQDSTEVFAAIMEAMTMLRTEVPTRADKMDPLREAYMRNQIRSAIKEGFQSIAVVCGAWHAPVLVTLPPAKDDAALLKGLPKIKTESTWIPWTHSRLSFASGYGAGVTSPGWYQHIWTHNNRLVERWITQAARLLREEDMDASSAHTIEAVRLAEALASMRDRPAPGLSELMESIQTVLCFGNDVPLRVIHEKLIVGEVMGTVPEATPSVPVQKDLLKEQKRLRLPGESGEKILDLDLRKEIDLDRSKLLHRLNLLDIPWGRSQTAKGKAGTFHEIWQLRWLPEYALPLIDSGKWGKTVKEAAENKTRETASETDELPELTKLLNAALQADLAAAVQFSMEKVKNVAAVAGDIGHLMDAIPDLVRLARYGNVRKTDSLAVEHILEGIISRVCISLSAACSAINDDAAGPMFVRIGAVHSAIQLLQNEEHTKDWLGSLFKIADSPGIHGMLAGRAARLLLEQRVIDAPDAARRLGLALSTATGTREAAAWAEGFLKGSGLLLIHDDTLWSVVDDWISSLTPEKFSDILPLLRRTFSTFEPAERRQMGEKVSRSSGGSEGALKTSQMPQQMDLDIARADAVIPVLSRILGIEQ